MWCARNGGCLYPHTWFSPDIRRPIRRSPTRTTHPLETLDEHWYFLARH